MADKLDLDANPYEALGLGEGSAELSMAEIKKARPRDGAQVCCACLCKRLTHAALARAGVPHDGAEAAPRQAQVDSARRRVRVRQ